jgi:hypothetical protein
MVALRGAYPAFPYADMQQELKAARSSQASHDAIANVPFHHQLESALLFLGFITFFLVDEAKQLVRIAAVSDNEYYDMAVSGYNFDPKKFTLSLDDADNSIVKSILSGKPETTIDWDTIKRPQADNEAARLNQASSGIACTVVYPLTGSKRGALMYNYFQYQDGVGEQQQDFMETYTDIVSKLLPS